jgi:hypothetical protein
MMHLQFCAFAKTMSGPREIFHDRSKDFRTMFGKKQNLEGEFASIFILSLGLANDDTIEVSPETPIRGQGFGAVSVLQLSGARA